MTPQNLQNKDVTTIISYLYLIPMKKYDLDVCSFICLLFVVLFVETNEISKKSLASLKNRSNRLLFIFTGFDEIIKFIISLNSKIHDAKC